MLKLYNKAHTFVGYINQFRDRKIESQVASGDKSMSFTLLEDITIENEFYIRDEKDEYVVKEIDRESNAFPVIYCALNLEELEGKAWKTFSVTNVTIEEAARTAINGTGWIVSASDVTKRRNAGIIKKSALGVLEDLKTAFMCEIEFDTLTKSIRFYTKRGSDKGVYFRSGLNLTRLSKKTLTYDYYTRIIPYGAEDIDITEVNSGKEYVENYQFSNKVRTYIWEDTNYTDKAALKEDAIAKLADMSKPEISYQADIIDLAEMSEDYDLLDYELGDTIYLVDKDTETKEKQRIVKMVEYPEAPENNTCELSNTSLTWEEMQARLQSAAAIIDAVVSSDGQYTGKISVSDILHFSDGVVDDTQGTTLAQYIQATDGRISAIALDVGTITTNYLRADTAAITYATITNLEAATGRIQTLETNSITSEYADLHYATIDLANIDTANVSKAKIKDLFVEVGLIKDAVIKDAKIVGYLDAVEVNAANITAGTLIADRIAIRGSTTSLVYALNNYGQITSQQTNTLDGYILTERSINADKIVARTITGNEIAANTITAFNIVGESLSAIYADLGIITAGVLKSADYESPATGSVYATAGMMVDLNNKVIRMPNTAILANGAFYTRSGQIGGWRIGPTSIYREVTGTDGATYTPQLYAPDNASTANGAFSIVKTLNGVTSYPFAIYYDGRIRATSGTVGGFTLTDTGLSTDNVWLYSSAASDGSYLGMKEGSGSSYRYLQVSPTQIGMYAGESSGRTLAHMWAVDSSTGECWGILRVAERSSAASTAETNSILIGRGGIDVTDNSGDAYVQLTSDSAEVQLIARNTGSHGLYSNTKSGWIIYCDSSGSSAYIPRALDTSGRIVAGGGVGTNGRVSYNDGKYGMWATTGGSIALRHDGSSGAGVIGWFYGSESSWSSQIKQTASGVLEAVGYFKMRTTGGNADTRRVAIGTATDAPASAGQHISHMWCGSAQVYINAEWGGTYDTRSISVPSSDIRLKKNVKDSAVNALNVLNKIRIREFDWKDGRHQIIGMVADEIEKIDPMLSIGGGTDEDGNICYKSVDDFYLDGYLVKGIQELYQTIENLKHEIKALKGEAA